jgi:uncharacterized protein
MTGRSLTGPQEPKPAAHQLNLRVLPARLAVCFLTHDSSLPDWATRGDFLSATRTNDELSVVCDHALVPADVSHEGPWACLQVEGPLDFALTGVLAGLAAPLAEAGISIFALSTYHTDYILVLDRDLNAALQALRTAGHSVGQSPQSL